MAEQNNEPVHLVENPETGDRFLVHATTTGTRLDIRFAGETLWMTQAQMAALFGVNIPSISRHVTNIIEEGELDGNSTVSKIETVRLEGSRRVARAIENYNLDMVISVGYRVSSAQATQFRRWATSILVQFAKKGFVVDSLRLKQPENADRIVELRDIIRDIRSDEANIYRELKQICAMCQDYDGRSESARAFYWHTQAKVVFAVTSQTPSEIISQRADHAADNMGLKSWPNDHIRKQDVIVSKNYLAESEIKELNRLTTILLDIFEDQLDLGRLVVMRDAQELLDRQLQGLGRNLLQHGGSVPAAKASRAAENEYEKFDLKRKEQRHAEADQNISALTAEAKKLPKTPRNS